jgi:hypothetical protein
LLFLAIVTAGYLLCWTSWRNGSVIATSQNLRLPAQPTIKVRKLPTSSPLWGLVFRGLEDNYLYRAEYYAYS